LELATQEFETRNEHVRGLRDYLWQLLPARLPGVRLTGPQDPARRLPNNLSVCVEGVEGESVLIQMDLNGIAASSGSACTTGSLEPSHVLTAMGLQADVARGSLRLTLGKDNTRADIDRLLDTLPVIVEKLRRLAPVQPVT
jgi:cysteine desulfurase